MTSDPVSPQSSPPPPRETRPLRWWPALVVLALGTSFLVWVWGIEEAQRQNKNLQTMSAVVVVFLLLLLWVVLLSRLPWRRRLTIVGTVFGLAAFAAATLRVRGVTGDFIPILEWRWTRSQPAIPNHTVAPATSRTPSLPSSAATLAFPQFRGPERDGIIRGVTLATNWPGSPPRELWRRPVGAAWSGFAVSPPYAVTLEQHGEEEVIACYDLLTGAPRWTHRARARYYTTIAGEGPRTVPALDADRVYAVGATGLLTCVRLTNGAPVWSVNIVTDNNGEVPDWGVSCSPLIQGDAVVVIPGGKPDRSLVAYNKDTGERLWNGGSHGAHFSSPELGQLHGTPQILSFNSSGVTAHLATNGAVLWEYPWPRGHPHVANPCILPPDQVVISSGYGTGAELVRVEKHPDATWTATRVWKSIRLKSKFANFIVHEGHIYGLDDGTLVCLDLKTGDLKWKEGRYGHGQILLVVPWLLIMAEGGHVVLHNASPVAPQEIARFKVFADKTWNPPALAGHYLVVRNDKEAACYLLP